MSILSRFAQVIILLMLASPHSFADEKNRIYPLAIFDFVEKSNKGSGMGEKVSDIVFSSLVVNSNITLVDRDELDKLENEAVLNLSGMISAQQANQIGQLTGAKIIVTGTFFEIEDKMILVAKIIGTETSRVLGASVKGNVNDSIVSLTEQLAVKIESIVINKADLLVAKSVSKDSRIAALKQQLKSIDKPSLVININEHHINRNTTDPAAETEMMYYSIASGFSVFDKTSAKSAKADIQISGEGFTEFAMQRRGLVGVKARLEVKAIDQVTGKVIAVDRQTTIEIDLSEIIASKKALARASAHIAERILPVVAAYTRSKNKH